MNDNSSRRVIAVVGMHRSGTSCLTGSLQQIGLELGQVHTWNRYNRRGNREQQDIVDLNDEVMAANGGAWDQPPAQCHWTSEQRAKARELVSALGDGPVVGFKDPRTLVTLDGGTGPWLCGEATIAVSGPSGAGAAFPWWTLIWMLTPICAA